jgi:hypothetical protein
MVPSLEPAMSLPHAFTLALGLAALPAAAADLLRDDFSDPASGWINKAATRDSDLGFAIYTDAGQYQMTPVSDATLGFVPAPRQADGGDVHMQADLFLYAGIGAGSGGLACRYQDHRNFYAFVARGDAVMAIVKIKDGQASLLAQARIKSLVPGTVDTRLTVDCQGDALRFSARDGGSIQARDGEFRAGQSGLVVAGQKMAGTSAAFDNFVLSAR